MIQRLAFCCTTLLLATTGCEKSSNPTTTPPPGDSAGAVAGDAGAAEGGDDTEPGAPDVPWEEKTFDQKKEWMGVEVFPKMKAAFKGYDEATYGKFKCETCHGEDGKAKGYEMPTDSIYPLPKENYIQAAKDYDEKVTAFMVDEVVPQMAELLGMQADTTGSGSGFGCLHCHPTE